MTLAFAEQFGAAEKAPFRLWAGPAAHEICGSVLCDNNGDIDVIPVLSAQLPREGPAVLVLADRDLTGPHRAALVDVARAARPGRPIVLYGAPEKRVLLDAINGWHAFRLLPTSIPSGVLAAAVRRAHEALTLELALELGAEQLHDECRRLESALEELRATQERLLHAERLTTIGRIVGTLIGQATDHLSTLEEFKAAQQQSPTDSVLAEELECASEGIDGFAALLRDMLALTEERPATAELQPEPLDRLVRRAVSLFAYDPVARRRHVSSMCHSNATVDADRPRLVHVLLNLLRNAAQATQDDGSIRVRTLCEGASAVVEIEDSGCGMSPEVLEHVFTPFFTTKGKAGMGLGLRLSRAAIEAHGGSLSCTSVPKEGTCFRIVLPLVE